MQINAQNKIYESLIIKGLIPNVISFQKKIQNFFVIDNVNERSSLSGEWSRDRISWDQN